MSHKFGAVEKRSEVVQSYIYITVQNGLARSTCRSVRLNALNVLHVHGPCFNAPLNLAAKILSVLLIGKVEGNQYLSINIHISRVTSLMVCY